MVIDRLDIINIIVVAMAPFIVALLSVIATIAYQRRESMKSILATLVETYQDRLEPAHIAALNRVPIVFYRKRRVKKAHEEYMKILQNSKRPADIRNDLFDSLLEAISNTIWFWYKFDSKKLRRTCYSPQGPYEVKSAQIENLELSKELLSGAIPLRVSFADSTPSAISIICGEGQRGCYIVGAKMPGGWVVGAIRFFPSTDRHQESRYIVLDTVGKQRVSLTVREVTSVYFQEESIDHAEHSTDAR